MKYISFPFPYGYLNNPSLLRDLLSPKETLSRNAQQVVHTSIGALPSPLAERLQNRLKLKGEALVNEYQLKFLIDAPQIPNSRPNTDRQISVRENLSQEFLFPDFPLIGIQMENKITSTPLSRPIEQAQDQLLQSSIKEKWGVGNVSVQISGMLHGRENYPLGQVLMMRSFFQEGYVRVEHKLLNELGISHLIIKHLDLPATSGHNQRYSIRTLSDATDYTLLEEN